MPNRPNHFLLRPCFACLFAAAPLLGLGLSSALAAATTPQYTVTDLGAIGYLAEEYNFSQAQLFRVNDNGFVAGTSAVSTASRAVVREPGAAGFTFLPDGGASAANAINVTNVIAGWSHVNHLPIATVWQQDSGGIWLAQTLRLPEGYTKSAAWDINDNGMIAGTVENDTGKYAVYWPAVAQDPVFVGGGNALFGEAFAVNNLGRIVGVAGRNVWGSINQSYYWDIGSAKMDIVPNISGPLGTGASSWGATDINEQNVIVGGANAKVTSGHFTWDQTEPYAWSATDGTQLIGTITSNNTWALAVNDAGYVVGEQQRVLSNAPANDPKNRSPLVYRQEMDAQGVTTWKQYDLSTQIPLADQPNWWFYSATGISSVGRIVGVGSLAVSGGLARHAYMLTPAVSDLSISQTVVAPAPSAKSRVARSKVSARAVSAQDTQIKLRVLNQGPLVATNVLVKTELPVGLSVDSTTAGEGSCVSTPTANGPTAVRCTFASLPVGSAGNVTLAVSAVAAGEFEITSTASATELDTLNDKNNRVSQKVAVAKGVVSDPAAGNQATPGTSTNNTGTNNTGTGNTGTGDSVDQSKSATTGSESSTTNQPQVQPQTNQQSSGSSTPTPATESSASAGSSDYSLGLLALSVVLGRFVRRRREGGGA